MSDMPGFQVPPQVFVIGFNTVKEFEDWANEQCFSDLREILEIFEEAEMYEYCDILVAAKERKLDEILGGFGFE